MAGTAAYEKMNVFERPDYASARIGYIRRGAEVMVRGPIDAADCGETGQKWFQLAEGGYACAGRGLLIGQPLSQHLFAPPPPDLTGPVPYRYGSIRRNRTPVYKRLPTPQQRQEVTAFLFPEVQEADAGADADAAADPELPAIAAPGDPLEGPPSGQGLWEVPAQPGESPDAGAAPPPAPDAGAEAEAEDAGLSDAERELLVRGPGHPLLVRVLMRGFTVAIVGSESADGRLWHRTVDGGYVDGSDVSEVGIRPSLEGMRLAGGATLPVGFVVGPRTRVYEKNDRGEIRATGEIRRFASFAVAGEERRGDRAFWATTDGRYVSQGRHVVAIDRVAPPRAVRERDKWIVIDLERQTLVAYEGDIPVFATLVSTGKEGHETPTGVFRILAKHVSNPMDDFALGEPYAIDEVPYVMYFQQNVAIHGAFWHRNFGYVRSHGCVNLSPSDARRLFEWTAPHMPEGWHGVYATDSNPGTIVWVRRPR